MMTVILASGGGWHGKPSSTPHLMTQLWLSGYGSINEMVVRWLFSSITYLKQIEAQLIFSMMAQF